jgi:hypothetical protein
MQEDAASIFRVEVSAVSRLNVKLLLAFATTFLVSGLAWGLNLFSSRHVHV